MIDSHELRRRDSYLNKLIGFQDTEPVKVITGIRRCGKSSLLKLMIQHLKDTGIQPEQIIEMNFESFDFRGKNAWIDCQDIRHRHKCRNTCKNLSFDVGVIFFKLKHLFQHIVFLLLSVSDIPSHSLKYPRTIFL